MRMVLPAGRRSAVVAGPFLTAIIGIGIAFWWCLVLTWWFTWYAMILPTYWITKWCLIVPACWLAMRGYQYARRMYREDQQSVQPPPPENPAKYSDRR